MKRKASSKIDSEKIVDEADQRFAELFMIQIDQENISDEKASKGKNRIVLDKDGNEVTL